MTTTTHPLHRAAPALSSDGAGAPGTDAPAQAPSATTPPHPRPTASAAPSAPSRLVERECITPPPQLLSDTSSTGAVAVSADYAPAEAESETGAPTADHSQENTATEQEPQRPATRAQDLRLEELLPDSPLLHTFEVLRRGMRYNEVAFLVAFLATCSALSKLGTMVVGNPITNLKVPTNNFTCIVGSSGSRKTALLKAAILEPVSEIVAKLREEHRRELEQWKIEYNATERGELKPPKPIQCCLYTTDFTIPSLTVQLQAHEQKSLPLLIFQDELSYLLSLTMKNKQIRTQLLELYDGSSSDVIRMAGHRGYTRSHCSIAGAIQEETLAGCLNLNDPDGFFSRFLYWPIEGALVPLPTEITEELQQQRTKAERHLEEIATRIFDQPARVYGLCEQGISELSRIDLLFQKDREEASLEGVRSLKGKTSGKILRVAGCLHQVDCASRQQAEFPSTIPLQTLRIAIRLVEASDHWMEIFLESLVAREASPGIKDCKLLRRIHTLARKLEGPQPWRKIREQLGQDERTGITPEKARGFLEELEKLRLGVLSEGQRGGLIYEATKDWPQSTL